MSWKEDLVTFLRTRRKESLGQDRLFIGITASLASYESLRRYVGAVNSQPIAWVDPGFLMLSRVTREDHWVWAVFELSAEEVIDSAGGEADFLSL